MQLVAALRRPEALDAFNEAQWSRLVTTARACNLLGALAARLQATQVVAPTAEARHLAGALQLSARQPLSVQWEAHALQA